jgi:Xaa-Pro aminopeptidase
MNSPYFSTHFSKQRESALNPHFRPATSAAPAAPVAHPEFLERRKRVFEAARRAGDNIDSLILCDPLDIHYLTGSRHGISWLIVGSDSHFAISSHMLVSDARREAVNCDILLASTTSTERAVLEQFIMQELRKRGLSSAVIDPAKLTARSYLQLLHHSELAGVALHMVPEVLSDVRAVKDPGELSLTRRCVDIAEQALSDLLAPGSSALIGRSEREVADELETRMWNLGADRQGFPETGIIVASGPNSACPHHTPGSRRISTGEAVLFDWGAELAGYRSDSTRTVFPCTVPAFALEAYPVVEQALLRASALLREGASMGEIDRTARETITDAGYPEFPYGVGHGVGLAIHEAPWLRAHSTDLCRSDMLTTIEPGVYLPGVGGIRIENIFRVTHDGCETLGSLPTNLESMVIA